MIVLGMIGLGFNPAACIVQDGRLVAMAEEERFTRSKGAFGHLPVQATDYCLQEAAIPLEAVDRIAFAWDARKYRWEMPLFFAGQRLRYGFRRTSGGNAVLLNLLLYQPEHVREQLVMAMRRRGHSGRMPPTEFVQHHKAHAASAYYCSGFEEAAVLVIDGSGERQCTTISRGRDLEITEVASLEIPDSLGWFYAGFTEFLGFAPNLDEGKLMGLAPYGQPSPELSEKLERVLPFVSGGSYRLDAGYFLLGYHNWGGSFSNALVELFGPPRLGQAPLTQHHKDLAYAVQARLEQAVLRLVRSTVESSGSRRLCLAGGVALNCKMNGAILRSGLVDDLFVQPASSDAGAALGAALIVSKEMGFDPRFRMQHAYWGPEYPDSEIRDELIRIGLDYETVECPEEKASLLIAQGHTVGWFQGRMEVGPRALGNRSMLASPTSREIRDRLNFRVKGREMWRPFCPSVASESCGDYFTQHAEFPFMIVAMETKEDRKPAIPGVIHVDGTARPQTVSKDINPRYWRLLRAFEKETGIPMVLNTSLNGRGEPIARSVQDALHCFFTSGLEYLCLGNHLVKK